MKWISFYDNKFYSKNFINISDIFEISVEKDEEYITLDFKMSNGEERSVDYDKREDIEELKRDCKLLNLDYDYIIKEGNYEK